MTQLDTLDFPLVVGDDYDVRRGITGLPAGDSVVDAWLTLRANAFSGSPIVLEKHITTADQAGIGQIVGDATAGLELVFRITAADSALLDPYTRYVYDIQLLTTTGKRFTREQGVVTPKAQVTTA